MTRAPLFRTGGLALGVGAVVFIAHLIARSVITAGLDPASVALHSAWVPISALGAVSAVLVLLGLPGLYTRMHGPIGRLGLVGGVLLAIAWLFFGVFLSFYSVLVVPWLAAHAPALVSATAPLSAGIIVTFILGLGAELVGSMLLAIPFMRGAAHPRWVGYLLPAAALLRVAGTIIAPTGPANNLAINLLSNLGPMLLLGTLGYLGFRMGRDDAPAGDDGGGRARFVGSR